MGRFAAWLSATARLCEKALFSIAVISLTSIVLVTLADIVMRYGPQRPLPWAYSFITYYLMVAALILSVASTQFHREHVVVDVVRRRMPARLGRYADAFTSLVAAFACGYVSFLLYDKLIESFREHHLITGELYMQIWPAHLMVFVGLLLACLRFSIQFVETLLGRPARALGSDDPSGE